MATRSQFNQRTCILVLIFCATFIIGEDDVKQPSSDVKCDKQDSLYVIRSIGTFGLVLDATDPAQIRLQHFTGSDSQLWKFKPADKLGLYFIINEQHRKMLDYNIGKDGHRLAAVNDLKEEDSLQQQWNVDLKGHIVNAANGSNVDIDSAKYTPGNRLILWRDNGCSCQRFVFQKKI